MLGKADKQGNILEVVSLERHSIVAIRYYLHQQLKCPKAFNEPCANH